MGSASKKFIIGQPGAGTGGVVYNPPELGTPHLTSPGHARPYPLNCPYGFFQEGNVCIPVAGSYKDPKVPTDIPTGPAYQAKGEILQVHVPRYTVRGQKFQLRILFRNMGNDRAKFYATVTVPALKITSQPTSGVGLMPGESGGIYKNLVMPADAPNDQLFPAQIQLNRTNYTDNQTVVDDVENSTIPGPNVAVPPDPTPTPTPTPGEPTAQQWITAYQRVIADIRAIAVHPHIADFYIASGAVQAHLNQHHQAALRELALLIGQPETQVYPTNSQKKTRMISIKVCEMMGIAIKPSAYEMINGTPPPTPTPNPTPPPTTPPAPYPTPIPPSTTGGRCDGNEALRKGWKYLNGYWYVAGMKMFKAGFPFPCPPGLTKGSGLSFGKCFPCGTIPTPTPTPPSPATNKIDVTPATLNAAGNLTITGTGWKAGETVKVYVDGVARTTRNRLAIKTKVAANGSFTDIVGVSTTMLNVGYLVIYFTAVGNMSSKQAYDSVTIST